MHATVDRQVKCDSILATLSIGKAVINNLRLRVGHSIPVHGEHLKCHDFPIRISSDLDRQVKCDSILATLSIGKAVIYNLRLCVGHSIPVPGEALTCNDRCIGMHATVDRQVKCDCVLATLSIGKAVVYNLRLCVGHSITVPGEALTCNDCCIGMHATVDRQVKCHCVLATLSIGKAVVYNLLFCALPIFPVPGEALTCNDSCIGMHATVDR